VGPLCRGCGMLGRSAAGGDARQFCRRWGCSGDLPPVGVLGQSATGGDARQFCRRSRFAWGRSAAGFDSGGTASPPSGRKTSCAGAPDAGSRPPSPALAGGGRFAPAIRGGHAPRYHIEEREAFLLENPRIRGEGGTARRRREGRDAHAEGQAPTREAARGVQCEQREALLVGPRPVDPSRRAREARVAGECRRGGGYATASGAPAHDVFGMSGGRRSLPPVKTPWRNCRVP
jgi:hypothetical protein